MDGRNIGWRLLVIVVGLAGGAAGVPSRATPIFVNEIHYDNAGLDAGEAIEVAGPAGASLAGWRLVLYNGSNGTAYRTLRLAGVIPDLGAGMGVRGFPVPGLQNGAPDGFALVDAAGGVAQLLSYEGSFTPASGPARGVPSLDIGLAEPPTTPPGTSLQLVGVGRGSADFDWRAGQASTFGAINRGQQFTASPRRLEPVAEPPARGLVLVALGLWAACRRRRAGGGTRRGKVGAGVFYSLAPAVRRPFF